ncbi:F-box only protein 6 [Tribolium castaneum]|nr:PREDICTED: F-box only protein 6 [Tribolium castaneum]|eukprot:XP_974744.2 PREDICTED: F-box only protein 6 [Tribolium castaneum]
MGNNLKKMLTNEETHQAMVDNFEPVETFKFHPPFPEDSNNGLYLNDFYLPEEIVTIILNYIPPKQVLKASLVCKKWCNIIKSDSFWSDIYSRRYNKKPKKLPWYVYYCLLTSDYFDKNLIKNGNGQNQYQNWKIVMNYGDGFRIEDPPCGSDPLPPDVPDFNGKTSCFATSYYECNKFQEVSLNNRLLRLIFMKYKPHIYLSEWVAARFDCGSVYHLICKLYGHKQDKTKTRSRRTDGDSSDDTEEEETEQPLHIEQKELRVEQWAGSTWSKVEMVVSDYPPGVDRIVFQHEGRDTQFWKGHYGSKMAGGVLKILFDSIEPLS